MRGTNSMASAVKPDSAKCETSSVLRRASKTPMIAEPRLQRADLVLARNADLHHHIHSMSDVAHSKADLCTCRLILSIAISRFLTATALHLHLMPCFDKARSRVRRKGDASLTLKMLFVDSDTHC